MHKTKEAAQARVVQMIEAKKKSILKQVAALDALVTKGMPIKAITPAERHIPKVEVGV